MIATIFVNPLQFGPNEDFDRYPRTLDADLDVLPGRGRRPGLRAGAARDVPGRRAGSRGSTRARSATVLEGASRPGHFHGVLTVVLKLLHLTRADVAFFGEKDYQQLTLIRRMVADLDLPVDDRRRADRAGARRPGAVQPQPLPVPAEQRQAALAPVGGAAGRRGRGRPAAAPTASLAAARKRAAQRRGVETDYLALTDPDLGPAPRRGPARLLVAARVGATRLIDNIDGLAGATLMLIRTMLKSKIHRATVTQADLHYVGSVTVDEDLLDAADLLPGEQVAIVDVTNGARLETYVIPGPRGSGVIGINGAAAHLVHPGDLVILISYAQMDDATARTLPAAGGACGRGQPHRPPGHGRGRACCRRDGELRRGDTLADGELAHGADSPRRAPDCLALG